MRNLLSALALMAMLAACAKLTVDSIDKTQEYRDRAELVRCQEGYTAACKHVQQLQQMQAEYAQPTISTLGGQQ